MGDAIRMRRGRADQVAIFSQPGKYAIINHDTVLAEHEPVTNTTGLQSKDVVNVDSIEKFARIRPFTFDLAEWRTIEESDASTDRKRFLPNGGFAVATIDCVIFRSLPGAIVFEYSPLINMPGVRRQQACRCVKISMPLPGNRTHWHRHELWSECRRADFCDRSVGQFGEQRQYVEVAGFTLIDCHSCGRVTLQMLDRNKVFAHRQFDIRHRDVMHEVDPLPGCVSCRCNSAGLEVVTVVHRSNSNRRTRETRFARRFSTCVRAVCERIRERKLALSGAGNHYVLSTRLWHETGQLSVIAQLPASLRKEVAGRVEATRHSETLTSDYAARAICRFFVVGQLANGDTGKELCANSVQNNGSRHDRYVTLTGLLRYFVRNFPSGIDNRRDADTIVVQGKRNLIRRIIIGRDHHDAGGFYGIAIHVLHRRMGQHDARSIVIFKNQRLFDGAGGQYDFFCPDFPKPFDTSRRPIGDGKNIVIVITRHRRRRHDRDVLSSFKSRYRPTNPGIGINIINDCALSEQAAARFMILFNQQHSRATVGRAQCRRQTCGSCADDQNVAMSIVVKILVLIFAAGQFSKPGHAANSAFVPVPVWPLEYLVVETCRPKIVCEVQHTTEVKVNAREAVRRFDLLAINQCTHGCTHNGHITIAIECAQQCIRFFHSRGHDAAWPMKFETSIDRADAVGQQCRCNGIALVALQLLTIEFERQWFTAIDSATG